MYVHFHSENVVKELATATLPDRDKITARTDEANNYTNILKYINKMKHDPVAYIRVRSAL